MSDNRDALLGFVAVAAGAGALVLLEKLIPKPEPKPWGSAFWLDPDLWDRVPKLANGRYGNCWEYLNARVIPDADLAFEKPAPPPATPKVGDVHEDKANNQMLLLTPDGWVPFAYAGIFNGTVDAISYDAQRRRQLWRKITEHGWVKSGDWDGGHRCEGCWERHTPGYHGRTTLPPDGTYITKPHFAPWLNSRWNESLRDPDPRKVKFA